MDATSPAWGTEFTTRNGSDEAFIEPCISGNLTLSLLTLIIALGGLVGNGIVLWLLGFRMQRNTFSVYVLNLAGADFFLLCCKIIWSLSEIITYYQLICSIPRFFTTVLCFAYIVGLSILSALSSERCLCVLCPIWYRVSRPRHLSSVVCALLWVLSLLLNILEGYYCGFLFGESEHKWCRIFDFIMTAWLIFLFVVLSGSSLALLTRILCGSWRMKLTRLYVTILLSGLVFLFCGLPFGIQFFPLYWIQQHSHTFYFYLQVGLVLSCMNSCANPIIYFFVGSCRQRQRLPQTLRLVLQKALQDIPETDESGSSLPRETMEMSGSSLV
ncbi:mas-related G-protein coupled receptor member X2 [Choloepus didactylus]|uniref:mas-related G-protein coupled receptor member X2 n=1 Tax=Choloepus didactylus TaxID=27675 RepID=UPI00189D0DD0|nr:mas-related G-protein coupled receptor member X2 [Choloepus didactylus]